LRGAVGRNGLASEGSVFYACGGQIPPQRDWSRRAFGPQLSREHVRLHKIILDYG